MSLPATTAFGNFDFGSIFGQQSSKPDASERERLKKELLETCRRQPLATRDDVEQKLADLTPFSPVRATAASPLLQKEWIL
jgi:hypothetical protein